MQNYIDSFMFDREIKDVSIILKFYLSQVFQRYGQPVNHCNVIISDCKDKSFKMSEVMSRYICPHKTILLINSDVSHHRVRSIVSVVINLLRFHRGNDHITSLIHVYMRLSNAGARSIAVRLRAFLTRISVVSVALHIWSRCASF